jgi:hypothetical protein
VAERPALLIAANFEGDQVIGSQIALYVAEALLTGYASNADIRQRLDHHAFYILPRVNPDGAELMFAPLKTGRKTNAAKYDNDNDGRLDEDGPEDLNKDGVITMMRVKDPDGPYMIHPDDPRLMRRADAARGEAGGYAIYWEGIDNDGDGFYNEDPPGGVDLNRNFQHQYPYYQPDAGPHMISEPEARGLMDYVLGRRNIAAILTFGESDNLIAPPTRTGAHAPASVIDLIGFANQSLAGARNVGRFAGPGAAFGGRGGRGGGAPPRRLLGVAGRGGRRPGPTPPATTVAATDVDYFRTISDRYRQLTGIRTRRPPGSRPARSSSTATTSSACRRSRRPAGGSPRRPARRPGRGSGPGRGGAAGGEAAQGAAPDAGRRRGCIRPPPLRWMDAEKIDGFVNWQPFKHPTLGDVEIGGFRPYAFSNPPAARSRSSARLTRSS